MPNEGRVVLPQQNARGGEEVAAMALRSLHALAAA